MFNFFNDKCFKGLASLLHDSKLSEYLLLAFLYNRLHILIKKCFQLLSSLVCVYIIALRLQKWKALEDLSGTFGSPLRVGGQQDKEHLEEFTEKLGCPRRLISAFLDKRLERLRCWVCTDKTRHAGLVFSLIEFSVVIILHSSIKEWWYAENKGEQGDSKRKNVGLLRIIALTWSWHNFWSFVTISPLFLVLPCAHLICKTEVTDSHIEILID